MKLVDQGRPPYYCITMSKVTSKRQVTIPKEVADRYRITPGDEIRWVPAGSEIRVLPPGAAPAHRLHAADRIELFDRATSRRDARESTASPSPDSHRGWTREELYERGGAG